MLYGPGTGKITLPVVDGEGETLLTTVKTFEVSEPFSMY